MAEIEKELEIIGQPEQNTENTEETKAPRGRVALRGRYKERHPDTNWDDVDDDALADQAMTDYDEAQDELGQYRDRDKSLEDLFAKNPQSAAFLMDMAEGGEDDAIERIYKHFGEDIVAAMDDPDEREKLKAIRKKKQEDLDRAAEQAKQWETNMQDSLHRLEAMKASKNLDDETVQQMLDLIDKVCTEFENGEITDDTYALFLKGIGYDNDVERAKVEGERNGRNAKIDEGMRRRAQENRNVPMMGGAAGEASGRPLSRKRSGMGNVGSGIWDTANMSRTKYE